MILTAGGKEVQFWVHLDHPDHSSPMESTSAAASTSGRPPLSHHSLARAASSACKEKSPEIYRSLSADGTRIYDSIKHPPSEENHHDVSSSSSSKIQYPNLQQQQEELSIDRSQSLKGAIIIPPAPPPPALIGLKKAKKCSSRSSLLHKEIVDTWDRMFFQGVNTDVTIVTVDDCEVHAHSMVLMCSSPILKCILKEEFRRSSRAFVYIRGVPFQAVQCFVRFLYSSRCEQGDMELYAIPLLVLAHAYMVPALKRLCTESFELGLLNSDNVVDVLQLSRLCDASRLQMLCLRRIVLDFKKVARSEAWRIMKESDPTLEQELVEAVIEAETKRRDRIRKQEEDKVYSQLHDAMEALVHICRDGCRSIGPHDKALNDGQQGACSYPACKGLESLVRHFAACKLKVSGGCVHCKRMWQLLELHSRMCPLQDSSCKVPLCRHFKERVGQQPSRKEENRWKMLVRKVQSSAKATSGPFSLLAVTARLSQVN